jgi:biopolymer transport protein ExbD
MRRTRQPLDFEINLLPIISILAVCISFLLITAVWIHVGAFGVNQAMGSEKSNAEPKATLWIEFENDGSIEFKVKEGSKVSARWLVKGLGNQRSDIARAQEFTARIKKARPELLTALVLPAPESSYQDMIAVMDGLKKEQIKDIGIAPL